MKKTLLSFLAALCCLFISQNIHAQRSIPLQLSLSSPKENAVIKYEETINVVLKIKNISASENLVAGDTVYTHLPTDAAGSYSGFILKSDLLAGKEQEITLNSLQNNNTGADATADFCISVIGTAQTTSGGGWKNPDFQNEACSKITLKGKTPTAIAAISAEAGSIQLYPNPAKTYANFAIEMTRPEVVSVSIKDITGREVRNMDLGRVMISGNTPARLSLEGLNAGIYIVDIFAGQQKFNGKLTIQ